MVDEIAIAEQCFAKIRDFYPDLEMRASSSEDGEPELFIPQQPGLRFDLELYLYSDILNLCAEAFWGEWFPCNDHNVLTKYVEAVSGLIEGSVRIVEHRRNDQILKVELQREIAGRWEPISTFYRGLYIPFLWTTKRVFQNIAA